MENVEKMTPSSWKKVLNFVIEVLKLVVAGFLGGSASGLM